MVFVQLRRPASLLLLLLLVACGSETAETAGGGAARTGGDTAAGSASVDDGAGPTDGAATVDPDTPDSSTAALEKPGDTATAAKPDVTGRRYDVRSGIIELKSSFMGNQKQTVYFDDFGRKEAIYANMEAGGMSSRTVMVMANGYNVVYDPEKKAGTRVDLSDALSTIGLGGIPNLGSLSDEAKKELKYTSIAGRTVLGRQTEGASIEVMGTPVKVWTWQGVPLRMEAAMQGQQMVVEATSVKTDVAVPADRFVVPSDVKLRDLKTGK